MANYNNNETYKLLELSENSESDFDLPELITTPRKKKIRRKLKRTRVASNFAQNYGHSQTITARMCNIRVITMWIAAVLLTTWIITLTWLAIVLHNEIQRLDSTVRQVVASSQGVPDALQKCHTISKSLQNNQTLIALQINTLKLQLENFTKDVSDMQLGLNKIQEKLHNVPEYVNVPQQFNEVTSSMANLGSQIKEIASTVAALKSSKEQLETRSKELFQNVTNLRQSIRNLQNISQIPSQVVNSKNNAEIENMFKIIDDIKNNITTINSTLSNNIIWIRDDLKKNNKNIEGISNVGQNMSARVSTLEGLCGKTSSNQITLSTNLKGFSDKLMKLSNTVENQSTQLGDLQTQLYQINKNSSELSAAINMLNHTLDENKATYLQTGTFYEHNLPKTIKTDDNPSTTVIQVEENNKSPITVTVQTPQSTSITSSVKDVNSKSSADAAAGKPSILTL